MSLLLRFSLLLLQILIEVINFLSSISSSRGKEPEWFHALYVVWSLVWQYCSFVARTVCMLSLHNRLIINDTVVTTTRPSSSSVAALADERQRTKDHHHNIGRRIISYRIVLYNRMKWHDSAAQHKTRGPTCEASTSEEEKEHPRTSGRTHIDSITKREIQCMWEDNRLPANCVQYYLCGLVVLLLFDLAVQL